MVCWARIETIQRVGVVDLSSKTERTIPVTDNPFQCRLFAPILSIAKASSLYWISNFDDLHASPIVAVRDTVPRSSGR
jgi:hypothetical protein